MNHFFASIEGWTHGLEGYYLKAVADAPADRLSRFVEIGGWLGRSSALMAVEILNSGKPIEFHVVDHWKGTVLNDDIALWITQHGKHAARNRFERNMAPVRHLIYVHDENSADAAADFADNSVDFCFVDGDHSKAGCLADLVAYWPKVREGGLMAGHDWNDPTTVNDAVLEFFAGVGKVESTAHCWSVRK